MAHQISPPHVQTQEHEPSPLVHHGKQESSQGVASQNPLHRMPRSAGVGTVYDEDAARSAIVHANAPESLSFFQAAKRVLPETYTTATNIASNIPGPTAIAINGADAGLQGIQGLYHSLIPGHQEKAGEHFEKMGFAVVGMTGMGAGAGKLAKSLLSKVRPRIEDVGYLQRGVAPAEAARAMEGHGSLGRNPEGAMMYTQQAKSDAPAFHFEGKDGMSPSSDHGKTAWFDMNFYSKAGAQMERLAREHPEKKFIDQRSMRDFADSYYPDERGVILTYHAKDIKAGTYNGNLRGNIKYVDPSAKPIGETPLPVGFDANDMPVFAEGSFSKLGPGNEWIK